MSQQIRVMADLTDEKLREGNKLAGRMKGLSTGDVIRVMVIAFMEIRRRAPEKATPEVIAAELVRGADEAERLGLT